MVAVSREWREIPGRYNLVGSKCSVCGKIYFPTRSFCPACRRASIGKVEPYSVSRIGEVYTCSIVHDAPECNNSIKPYAVAMVKMSDGVMIAGQLTNVDLGKVAIGMKVRATLRKLDEDGPAGVIHYGYKFVPLEE
ncbi:MAG: Zn-ribbon domain-containing OB-fold protein [Candidatus Methanomethylophilaceae archaeon]|jgi:uncharacterized OB-fold protein|nr:Zn-ribbon domain-containing OB-fold protein [Candidatus Methanomethylophilaceae archaeon]